MTNTIEIENLNISDLDIPTDETLQEVATACEDIATSSEGIVTSCESVATACGDIAKDTTLQSTNTALGSLATDATLQATNTALGSLMADTTGQSIATAITGLSGAISPAASNVTYDNTDSSLSASNVKVALDELDDEKVSKSGDTMTGDLTVEKGSPRFNADNNAVTLSTATNNGVSSTTYCGLSIRDSNNSQIGLLENIAGTDGTISTRVTARNMDRSGNAVSNSLQVIARKNGTMGYSVSDAGAFRKAINTETASIIRASGVSSNVPIPDIVRQGNVVIIHFAHQFQAGTYYNLYKVSPLPIGNQHAMLDLGGQNRTIIALLSDGTMRFNVSTTLSTTQYVIGQLVYLTDE